MPFLPFYTILNLISSHFTSILIFCYKHTNTRRILTLPLSIILKQNNNNGYSVILFAIIIIITIAIHTSIKICIPHFMCDSREINMIFTVECISCGWWGLLQICDKSNIARERFILSHHASKYQLTCCHGFAENWIFFVAYAVTHNRSQLPKRPVSIWVFMLRFFIPCFLVPIKRHHNNIITSRYMYLHYVSWSFLFQRIIYKMLCFIDRIY